MGFSAVILAAGLSSRMGVPKPLLPVGQKPALCVAAAAFAGVEDIIIVTGSFRREIEELVQAEISFARTVHNARFNDGMFSSVLTGIGALPRECDGFFLLPADTCLVSPDTISLLFEKFTETGGKTVLYPVSGGPRGHPPLIPGGFAEGISDFSGEGGMKAYLEKFPSAEIETGDAGILLDMDTPSDYAALLKYAGLPAFPDGAARAALYEKYNVSASIIGHMALVAETALEIAELINARGAKIDCGLLYSACLVHDILRAEPEHALAGSRALLRAGYPAAAALVQHHMELPRECLGTISETTILYLADKLCRDGKIVPLEETSSELHTRFADNPEARKGAARKIEAAASVLAALTKKYGITFEDISAM